MIHKSTKILEAQEKSMHQARYIRLLLLKLIIIWGGGGGSLHIKFKCVKKKMGQFLMP